ncbi:MAG: UDP-N-acetylmuramoyl-L-alanyl-D-glutamate--2,6-diaminopimelate ligase [bacterium]|nr:UDP-N-acetylmuramoyl-L-alanyl-D-glutamate--2,6-diaminopimelate ligase [bacterium]
MVIAQEKFFGFIRRLMPRAVFKRLNPLYHKFLALLAVLIYRFPSRNIFVLGITGTKGKTSVAELVSAILEEAGFKTALISTLRFKIGDDSERNELKMTMPGRFFVQKFLRNAVEQHCRYALLEITSQAVLQCRHKFIDLDAVVFTNLSPEHIEAHGSFEQYKKSKLRILSALENSSKKRKTIIVNADDENAHSFADFKIDALWLYGLKKDNQSFFKDMPCKNLQGIAVSRYELKEDGIYFEIDKEPFFSPLLAEFNLYNILAAVSFARSQNIGWDVIRVALQKFAGVSGRLEFIKEGQNFKVVVDYAHTPDSLQKVYELFKGKKICVLGSAGGGRDKWKRAEMGKISANYCGEIILTNEDPYDENPAAIIQDIAFGIEAPCKYKIIMDRRQAIQEAIGLAQPNDIVIITGKGAEPWIMGPNGSKIRWDDREAAREALKKHYA